MTKEKFGKYQNDHLCRLKGDGGPVFRILLKALNTINHQLLITKLNVCDALEIILKYSLDHWPRVKVNPTFSTGMELIQEVPQGLVLTPVSFNVYINDLSFLLCGILCR